MNRICRIVLLGLLLAALPMRGYAGVLISLCEAHHGGAPAAQEHAHEHSDGNHGNHGNTGDNGGVPTHARVIGSVTFSKRVRSAGTESERP